MAYEAKAVANYFLDLANSDKEGISPMKMQKLIYFAHGWCLAITKRPLIKERIEAWEYGPVISSIYQEFKEFGNESITRHARSIDINSFSFNTPRIPKDRENKKLLNKIWEVYGVFSAVKLSKMTHQPGTPWDETRELYGTSKNTIIDDEMIREYFVNQAKENDDG